MSNDSAREALVEIEWQGFNGHPPNTGTPFDHIADHQATFTREGLRWHRTPVAGELVRFPTGNPEHGKSNVFAVESVEWMQDGSPLIRLVTLQDQDGNTHAAKAIAAAGFVPEVDANLPPALRHLLLT